MTRDANSQALRLVADEMVGAVEKEIDARKAIAEVNDTPATTALRLSNENIARLKKNNATRREELAMFRDRLRQAEEILKDFEAEAEEESEVIRIHEEMQAQLSAFTRKARIRRPRKAKGASADGLDDSGKPAALPARNRKPAADKAVA